jgi:hypothetical protein
VESVVVAGGGGGVELACNESGQCERACVFCIRTIDVERKAVGRYSCSNGEQALPGGRGGSQGRLMLTSVVSAATGDLRLPCGLGVLGPAEATAGGRRRQSKLRQRQLSIGVPRSRACELGGGGGLAARVARCASCCEDGCLPTLLAPLRRLLWRLLLRRLRLGRRCRRL